MERTIKFTKEVEDKGKIALLDVLVSRDENGAIMTEVYRKPTHRRHYLSYHSYHPVEHKEAI